MDFQMANAFLRIPYGIYVLAASQGLQPQAMVVSWVSQVSYSPPLLAVALRHNRPAIPAIQDQGVSSLNLLRAEQVSLVKRFKHPLLATDAAQLFAEVRIGAKTFLCLKDSLAWWGCQVASKIETGDHFLFINEAFAASAEDGNPLVTSDCEKTYIGQT
jgi:flavin reductase (DIM6/NTAB) family NADH-FMN oxidoreductase RutF